MDAPTLELMRALSSLLNSGKYSDLTITCGLKSYSVHRALLATRSTFFERACRNGFREAQSGIIDLSEEDAEAVEYMVQYFYQNDYLNHSLSRRSSTKSSRSGSLPSLRASSTLSTPKPNFALSEDPLLAEATAASKSLNTSTANSPAFQNVDPTFKASDIPTADLFEDDNADSVGSEPEITIQTSQLNTHAKVYAIAEKYGIVGLKALSRQKFIDQMCVHLSSPDFPVACQEAYESTYHTDRGLRDVIIQAFRSNPDLSRRPEVEAVIRETPGLAWELYQMASGLPVGS